MSGIRYQRINEEIRNWYRNHPIDFVANPATDEEGSLNTAVWNCVIPGEKGSLWEGGRYKLRITFPEDYPTSPPNCKFDPPLFHPNVYPSGTVSMPLLDDNKDWNPAITIEEILLAIQRLLSEPNITYPAQVEAYVMYYQDPSEYEKHARAQACTMAPIEWFEEVEAANSKNRESHTEV